MAKKIRIYSEAELISDFGLTRLVGNKNHPLMEEWTKMGLVELSATEQEIYNDILQEAQQKIAGWQEKDLKMKFISFVLRLGHLKDNPLFNTYFEKTVSATVDGKYLKTKTDFMAAKGILDRPEKPFFHFQEWKPQKRPVGDSMGQLLEAFLIAQTFNQADFPLYSCEVIGREWNFVVMQDRTYCISKSYICTDETDLLEIISLLRHFRTLLERRLTVKS
jgi:hypothetical protein